MVTLREMQATNRIIFNTVVLYAKIVICVGISLYTVPLVLHALGESDYGLYNLIAGLVAMLAFMNGAMTVSTQRYLSVTIGERDSQKLLQVFNLSILLHIILGLIVVLLIEAVSPLLFAYFLNIAPEQDGVAHLLLHCLMISMFFSIVTVPLDAVLNAYENMLFFSIAGIIEAVLKLAVAWAITILISYRLTFYGIAISLISIVVFLIKYLYCRIKYRQLYLSASACRNKKLLQEMIHFAGWNMLSTFALVGRVQGLAIILNHFLGTVINAAYGIATQVNGVLSYFTSTIQKSVNPQLMESESTHESKKQVELTFALTKFSMLILCAVSAPLIVEMTFIFENWLSNVPKYTIEFTQVIIILAIIMQSSAGLMSAVQSSGKIKWYTICVSLTLLSALFIAYGILQHGAVTVKDIVAAYPDAVPALRVSPVWTLWGAVLTEVIAVLVRFYFARKLKAISIWSYFKEAVLPNALLFLFVCGVLWACTLVMEPSLPRLILVCVLDAVLFILLSYHLVLTSSEREYLVSAVRKIIRKK